MARPPARTVRARLAGLARRGTGSRDGRFREIDLRLGRAGLGVRRVRQGEDGQPPSGRLRHRTRHLDRRRSFDRRLANVAQPASQFVPRIGLFAGRGVPRPRQRRKGPEPQRRRLRDPAFRVHADRVRQRAVRPHGRDAPGRHVHPQPDGRVLTGDRGCGRGGEHQRRYGQGDRSPESPSAPRLQPVPLSRFPLSLRLPGGRRRGAGHRQLLPCPGGCNVHHSDHDPLSQSENASP